jgi:hypothetical protein
MVLISGLKCLLGWKLAVVWSLWLCRNDKFLMIKLFSLIGYLQMYRYSPFMVTSSADGESQPIYGGLYMVRDYGEGYFFPTWVTA